MSARGKTIVRKNQIEDLAGFEQELSQLRIDLDNLTIGQSPRAESLSGWSYLISDIDESVIGDFDILGGNKTVINFFNNLGYNPEDFIQGNLFIPLREGDLYLIRLTMKGVPFVDNRNLQVHLDVVDTNAPFSTIFSDDRPLNLGAGVEHTISHNIQLFAGTFAMQGVTFRIFTDGLVNISGISLLVTRLVEGED